MAPAQALTVCAGCIWWAVRPSDYPDIRINRYPDSTLAYSFSLTRLSLSNARARAQVSLTNGLGRAVDAARLCDRDGGGEADAVAAGYEHRPCAASGCASQSLREGLRGGAERGGVVSSGSYWCVSRMLR